MVKKSTISRRESLYFKMYNAGITYNQVKKMSVSEFNKTFNTQIGKRIQKDKSLTQAQKDKKIQKSLEGRKRLLNQIVNNKSQVLKYHFKKRGISNVRVQKHHKEEFDNLFILQKKQTITSKQQQKQFLDDTIKDARKQVSGREGTYNMSKVLATEFSKIDGKTYEREFFIRWRTEKDLERQLNTIRESYNISLFQANFLGTFSYQTKLRNDFKDIINLKYAN